MTGNSRETPPAPGRLITIPPSNDCETGRWLLERYRVPFVEKTHAPLLHEFVLNHYGQKAELKRQGSLRAAGLLPDQPLTYPLLVRDEGKLWNCRQIITHFETVVPGELRLVPDGKAAEFWTLWSWFHESYSYHTSFWYYWEVLPYKDAALPAFTAGVPRIEVFFEPLIYPVLKAAVIKKLGLSQQVADEARESMDHTFDEVADLLGDGRPFLMGETFTAIDLYFAATTAPLVAAPGYGARPDDLPAFDALPPKMQDAIGHWRRHETGRWVLRIYEKYRRQPEAA